VRGNFYILLVSPDEQLSSTYASKIKDRFGELPLFIDFAHDGLKALEKFEKHFHHLVISDIEMPVMDGLSLVSEIRKIEGSSIIYLLGNSKLKMDEPGVEFINTPITDWTEFIGKVEDVIPEEIKIEYGLKKRDTALNRRLNDFSKKYLEENGIKAESSGNDDIFLIPKYFYGLEEEHLAKENAQEGENTISRKVNQKGVGSTEGMVVFPFLKRRLIFQSILELLILAGLAYATYHLFTAKPSGGEDDFGEENLFINLKNVMALITIVSFLGYFLGKVFEKIFIKKNSK
tara:strand:- start:3749 stop:4615 length:867 start_codon:yes stop_codon:yes gene_type:complete